MIHLLNDQTRRAACGRGRQAGVTSDPMAVRCARCRRTLKFLMVLAHLDWDDADKLASEHGGVRQAVAYVEGR